MQTCLICNFLAKNARSLSAHIVQAHQLSKKEYFDSHLKKESDSKCETCNNETKFRSDHYLRFCSNVCMHLSSDIRQKRKLNMLGRIQTEETISKRISNTDQLEKEKTRISTMLEKYGSLSVYDAMSEERKIEVKNKITEKRTGEKHSKEHHIKVINSKRKNGTLKHTEKTKRKMSKTHLENYQRENPPNYMSNHRVIKKGFKTGYFNDLFFRSSYEERFLIECKKANIEVQSAETKKFRIPYYLVDEIRKFYYPDFYLPKYNCIVEIKPLSMLDDDIVSLKTQAALLSKTDYNYIILTEEELFSKHNEWIKNLEYLLP